MPTPGIRSLQLRSKSGFGRLPKFLEDDATGANEGKEAPNGGIRVKLIGGPQERLIGKKFFFSCTLSGES